MFIPPLHWCPLLHITSWSEVTQTTNLNTRNLRCYMYNIFTEFLCIFLRRNLTPIVIVPNPSLMFWKILYLYYLLMLSHYLQLFYSYQKKKMLDFFPKKFKMILNYLRLWKNVTLYMIKIKWLSPILIEMSSVVMMKGAKMLKFKDQRKDSQTDGRKSDQKFSF